MIKLFAAFGGRTTSFALLLLAIGCFFQWFGKLNGEFIVFLGGIQAILTTRAVMQDKWAGTPKPPQASAG